MSKDGYLDIETEKNLRERLRNRGLSEYKFLCQCPIIYKYKLIIISFWFFITIAGCGHNHANFSLSAVSSMVRVPLEPGSPVNASDTARISGAGGEYESFQILVSPCDSATITGVCWEAGPLRGDSGSIDTQQIQINPVGYIQTTVTSKQYPSSLGWWADPLLNLDSLSIPAGELQPLWVTIFVPRGTPSGTYHGTVRVRTTSAGSSSIPVELRVWGFDIPCKPSIKTLTWVSTLRDFGGNSRENRKALYELLLEHHLGPGGKMELDEEMLGFCMQRGMNAFILDNIPNLKRIKQDNYSEAYKDSLQVELDDYVKKFGPRGWLDGMAYVYNYDEVDRDHWPLAKDMYSLVKSVSSDLKVIQCLNIPEGVEALAGYADTWDVYMAQFKKSGVEQRVAAGDEAWLAVCCYPSVRPNLFLEYPAIDGRIMGWICYHTGVTGFEYWSPNHWDGNDSPPELRGNWKANTFGNYNGDGYLTYPGPDMHPLSSIRLENLRDGLEDYEYLHLLKELEGDSVLTQLIPQVVSAPTEYSSDTELLYHVRKEIAQRIEEITNRK